MKATELRIGNYHYYHMDDKFDERKEWDEICQIDYGDLRILFTYEDNSEYKPIPLTEEWLLKFGFEKEGGYLWNCKLLGKQRFIENHLTKGYFETHYESKHIQYVHQLQNLYFALTGEELTIKDND